MVANEKSVLDHLDMLNRRKVPFLAVLAMVVAITLSLVFGLPSIYRSTAMILIEDQDIPEELVKSTITTYADQRIQQISRRILSNASLSLIVEKHNLYSDYRDQYSQSAIVRKMKNSIVFKMSRAEVKKGRGMDKKQPEIAFTASFDYPNDPQLAQIVTGEIVELFLKQNEIDRKRTSEGAYSFLFSELHRLEDEATRIDLKMAEFKRENKGMLPEQAGVSLRVADRLDRDITETTRQLFDLKQQNIILRSELSRVSKYIDAPNLTNDLGERVMSAGGRMQVLKSTYVTLLSKYAPEHPKLKKIENEIASLGGDLDFSGSVGSAYSELSRLNEELVNLKESYSSDDPEISRLENRVRSLKSQIGIFAASENTNLVPEFTKELNPAYMSITTQLKVNDVTIQSLERKKLQYRTKQAGVEQDLMMSPMVEMRFNQLSREYKAALNRINNVQAKLNAAEMSDKLESSKSAERFTLVEPPLVPGSSKAPNKKQILLLGLLAAVGLGFAVSYLFESFDRSVFNNRVMAKITGVQPLSVIPYMGTVSEAEDRKRVLFMVIGYSLPLMLIALGIRYLHFNVISLHAVWAWYVHWLELLMF